MNQADHAKAFCSWSGGKDCCLALDRFRRTRPDCAVTLLTMLTPERRTYAHGLSESLLRAQAQALGLPIVFGESSNHEEYEARWKEAQSPLIAGGVSAGIFGDIDLQAHYDWIHRVMSEQGLDTLMPLWQNARRDVVAEYIQRGFKARIISVDKARMSDRFLGMQLDGRTVELLEAEGIDPSGEGGEFHTLTVDGPLFRSALRLGEATRIEDDKHITLRFD